jgi:type IV secretion system protein TrbL
MMKRLLIIFGVLFLTPAFLYGAIGTTDNTATLLATFQTATASWRAAIVPAAMFVFWALATADFVLEFGLLAVGGKVDFSDFFPLLIRKTLIIGFFLMLFQHSDWLATIPASFSQIANSAAGVAVDPDNVLDAALNIVGSILHGVSFFHPGDSLALVLSAFIILIAFGKMVAQMVMTYVKTYIFLAIAPLLFSLAGLGQTRQMAYNPIFTIIKAGMELMLIKLVLGLSITMMHDFAVNIDNDDGSIMVMIIMSIVLASLVDMIPGMVEAIASGGVAQNSTSGLGTLQTVAAGAAGAVAGAAGMGAAVKAASNLAKEQRAGGDSSASTFKNLRSAFANDVQRSMAGENIGGGTMGARMAFKHSSDSSLMAQTKAMQGTGSSRADVSKAQTANEEAGFVASQGN